MAKILNSYWELVEPIFSDINTEGAASYFASIVAVPRPVLLLYAAHFCIAEVFNGGLLQFFWNSTGVIAPEAIEGLVAVGMPRLAAVLSHATMLLGSPYPRDRDDRWDALLVASGKSASELESIFEKAVNLYLAFQEATLPLSLDELNKEAWELARTENDGFQDAATRYAKRFLASEERMSSDEC